MIKKIKMMKKEMEEKINVIKSLLLIRMIEQEICNRYGSVGEKQEMRCPVHISIGQEGIAVGVCSNLLKTDIIFSGHRSHAHYLAKGGSPQKMINEIYGKIGGCVDGRGGSMHLMDVSAGVTMSIPIVASAIPLAVGSALANKLNKNNSLVVVFFGDGAVEEGVFHESLNFASINRLRIAFICENNNYSIFTPLKERQPLRPIKLLGQAHGITSYEINDTDAISLKDKINNIFSVTRKQAEPCFLVLNTYRVQQHCGVQKDDHLEYRSPSEIASGLKNDPVKITCENAIKNGLLDENKLKKIKKQIHSDIVTIFNNAEKLPLPTPDMAKKYVYWSKS